MRRGDLVWADLGPPAGRRPVCVLTRDAAITVLGALTVAPLTRTVRGISSEVPVGAGAGLGEPGVISCDNLLTVPVDAFDPRPAGHLEPADVVALDRALRYALDIRF